MISKSDQELILRSTTEYWKRAVNEESFTSLFAGREVGHRMAPFVEEKSVEVLASNLTIVPEVTDSGELISRSMGDCWVVSSGMRNAVNVKAGEREKEGSPNIVALNKLLTALHASKIDSYYLLIVKVGKGESGLLEPTVSFVDILDWLDYVSFDAGPGQLMLREKAFNQVLAAGSAPTVRTLVEKVDYLEKLYESGIERLIESRRESLGKIKADGAEFLLKKDYKVNQEGMNFGYCEE